MYLFILREKGREGEKHQCVVASHTAPTGDLARSPSICPDWELNQRPFGLQAGAQSTEPHQPGLYKFLNVNITKAYKAIVSLDFFLCFHHVWFCLPLNPHYMLYHSCYTSHYLLCRRRINSSFPVSYV